VIRRLAERGQDSTNATRCHHYRVRQMEARVARIVPAIHADLLRLSSGLLARDVARVFGVSPRVALTAVLQARVSGVQAG